MSDSHGDAITSPAETAETAAITASGEARLSAHANTSTVAEGIVPEQADGGDSAITHAAGFTDQSLADVDAAPVAASASDSGRPDELGPTASAAASEGSAAFNSHAVADSTASEALSEPHSGAQGREAADTAGSAARPVSQNAQLDGGSTDAASGDAGPPSAQPSAAAAPDATALPAEPVSASGMSPRRSRLLSADAQRLPPSLQQQTPPRSSSAGPRAMLPALQPAPTSPRQSLTLGAAGSRQGSARAHTSMSRKSSRSDVGGERPLDMFVGPSHGSEAEVAVASAVTRDEARVLNGRAEVQSGQVDPLRRSLDGSPDPRPSGTTASQQNSPRRVAHRLLSRSSKDGGAGGGMEAPGGAGGDAGHRLAQSTPGTPEWAAGRGPVSGRGSPAWRLSDTSGALPLGDRDGLPLAVAVGRGSSFGTHSPSGAHMVHVSDAAAAASSGDTYALAALAGGSRAGEAWPPPLRKEESLEPGANPLPPADEHVGPFAERKKALTRPAGSLPPPNARRMPRRAGDVNHSLGTLLHQSSTMGPAHLTPPRAHTPDLQPLKVGGHGPDAAVRTSQQAESIASPKAFADKHHVLGGAKGGLSDARAWVEHLQASVDTTSGLDSLVAVRSMKSQDPKAWSHHKYHLSGAPGAPPLSNTGGGVLPPGKVQAGMLRRLRAVQHTASGDALFMRKSMPRPVTPEGIELDGFMLLDEGDEELPEALVTIRLAERNIHAVETPDLTFFLALAEVDLTGNRLPDMACLANLPALRSLRLTGNRLKDLVKAPAPVEDDAKSVKRPSAASSGSPVSIWGGALPRKAGQEPGARAAARAAKAAVAAAAAAALPPSLPFPDGAFGALTALDISFNELSADIVLGSSSPLAKLPRLTELNANSNPMGALPSVGVKAFALLRVLHLESCGLRSKALLPLGALPQLAQLFLAHNEITAAPEGITAANAEGTGPSCFVNLQLLDLSHNRVTSEAAVEVLRSLPRLRRLILAGNPLVAAVSLARKRAAAAAREQGIPSSIDGTIPLELLGGADKVPLDIAAYGGLVKTSIASIFTRKFVRIREDSSAAAQLAAASTAAIAAAAAPERVDEAFDRIDETVDAWQLNTVNEDDGEGDADDTETLRDNTFLTGVGLVGQLADVDEEDEEGAAEASQAAVTEVEAADRPLWMDVSDPTERLALALGLDVQRLAIHDGHLTTDSAGTVHALRFALARPLVAADDGLHAPSHFQSMTAASALKRRDRVVLVPLSQAATASVQHPPDAKTVKLQTIEGMLQGMKDRLRRLESTLTTQLAAAPRKAVSPVGRSPSMAESRDSFLDGSDDESVDGITPQMSSVAPSMGDRALRPTLSQMSSLPDDVIAQIEDDTASDRSFNTDDDTESQSAAGMSSPTPGTPQAAGGGGGLGTINEGGSAGHSPAPGGTPRQHHLRSRSPSPSLGGSSRAGSRLGTPSGGAGGSSAAAGGTTQPRVVVPTGAVTVLGYA